MQFPSDKLIYDLQYSLCKFYIKLHKSKEWFALKNILWLEMFFVNLSY